MTDLNKLVDDINELLKGLGLRGAAPKPAANPNAATPRGPGGAPQAPFNPSEHPRYPKGHPQAGHFMPSGSSANKPTVDPKAATARYMEAGKRASAKGREAKRYTLEAEQHPDGSRAARVTHSTASLTHRQAEKLQLDAVYTAREAKLPEAARAHQTAADYHQSMYHYHKTRSGGSINGHPTN